MKNNTARGGVNPLSRVLRLGRGLLLLGLVIWNPPLWAEPATATRAPAVVVATSIKPLALLAEELLAPVQPGAVKVIVPRSASPHGFSLQPSDMRLVITAPLLLWLGPDFEPYLAKALAKRPGNGTKRVVTAETLTGMTLLPVRDVAAEAEAGHRHHHDDHQHAAGHFDPHLWWDSGNALVIAEALVRELSALYPQWQAALSRSQQAFAERVAESRQALLKTRPEHPEGFLIYHDSLIYLENELGLSSRRRITRTPEDKPSVRDMLSLSGMLNEGSLSCVITEPGINPALLGKLNPGGRLQEIEIDPLGWDATSYSDMWLKGAGALMKCAGGSPP